VALSGLFVVCIDPGEMMIPAAMRHRSINDKTDTPHFDQG
jgi:hypothetical protein